jgi:NhaA family Na+:H+ antiporter
MKTHLSKLFSEFLRSEQASGFVLILCTIASLGMANSSFGAGYADFWHTKIGFETGSLALKHSIGHWINDGLMAIFFLLIGLEIERELYVGELSDRKNAVLPVFAAVGGMLVPALCHFLLNRGTETQSGIAIPMATDIAFALGILALLGNRIPLSLKIFLTALAIIDDLGAIVIIALFYGGDFSLFYFTLAGGTFMGLLALNRLGVNRLSVYIVSGVFLWYFMLNSGIHATLAGVLLAFAVPFRKGDEKSPSYRLQHFLHKPVAFIIMPIFALANTGIVLAENWVEGLATLNSLGIFTGLYIGKPLGIVLFCLLAVGMGLSRLPGEVSWRHIVGAGFLGGIGFTMSIFISLLAFVNPETVGYAKTTVLLSSLLSALTGFLILHTSTTGKTVDPDPPGHSPRGASE